VDFLLVDLYPLSYRGIPVFIFLFDLCFRNIWSDPSVYIVSRPWPIFRYRSVRSELSVR